MNSLTSKSILLSFLILIMSSLALNAQSNSAQQQPFPKFTHTGNPELDKKNHEKAIIEWRKTEAERKAGAKHDNNQLKSSPVKSDAKQLNNQTNPKVDRSTPKKTSYTDGKVLRTQKIIDQPHAPLYTYTGNQKMDDLKYAKSKTEWAEKYPAEYKAALRANKSETKSALKRKPTTNK